METWKPALNYEGFYEVSSIGRVRRVTSGKIIQPSITGGYYRLSFSKNGKIRLVSVHRLVVEAFIARIAPKLHVNHKNGIKLDNRFENLEIVTPKENCIHARKVLGLHVFGEHNPAAKLTEKQVLEIRGLYKKGRSKDLAKQFGVNINTIWSVVFRRHWKHI